MLSGSGAEVVVERSTRGEPLSEADARALLRRARRVLVARGRKVVELRPASARPDDLKGPTGNFRAPLLLIGDTLLVGFHRETLAELVG